MFLIAKYAIILNGKKGRSVTKKDKLIEKILDGKIITTKEAQKVLDWLGYSENISRKGSHATYRKENKTPITIVLTNKDVPHYILDMLQKAVEENKDD